MRGGILNRTLSGIPFLVVLKKLDLTDVALDEIEEYKISLLLITNLRRSAAYIDANILAYFEA